MKPEAKSCIEQKVLLASLGCPSMAAGGASLPAMLRQVNWQKLLAVTSPDLYPFLCSSLEPYLKGSETPTEWELLRTARRLTAVCNLRLRHELARVCGALTDAGIPVLALKGIVLACAIYKDLALRPMTDLDLLVSPRDRENALLVLRKLGYVYPQEMILLRDHIWRLLPEQEFAPPLQSSESKVLLDIHTELECSEPTLQAPLNEFWSRSTTAVFGGLSIRTLCPEDNLFHICLHQARAHRFEKGLLPLLDIKVLLDSYRGWDWMRIAARSLRQGCATWMYLTLEAARDFTGAAVPDSFFQALPEPRDLPKLRGLVEEQILSARAGGLPPALIPALLAEHSWLRRAQMLFIRAKLVRGEEFRQPEKSAGFLMLAQVFRRRLVATMRTRIPKYFHAWRTGRLRAGAIWRSALLFRNSNILFALVEQGDKFADDRTLPVSLENLKIPERM